MLTSGDAAAAADKDRMARSFMMGRENEYTDKARRNTLLRAEWRKGRVGEIRVFVGCRMREC